MRDSLFVTLLLYLQTTRDEQTVGLLFNRSNFRYEFQERALNDFRNVCHDGQASVVKGIVGHF